MVRYKGTMQPSQFDYEIEVIINNVIETIATEEYMRDEVFNDKFYDEVHSEIDYYVSNISEEELEDIIEINGGFIKSIKKYANEYGGLNELFEADDIKIKRQIAYAIVKQRIDNEDPHATYVHYVLIQEEKEEKLSSNTESDQDSESEKDE
jgi:hypothetical protein